MVVLPNILFIIRLHRMKFRLNGLIYTYDSGNALIRKDVLGENSSYFTYDCRGNCTAIQESDGTTYMQYNHANLVTDIRFKTGVCNYFWYDAQLRRYAMQDSDGLRYFTWDGLNLLVEQDDAGDVVAEYTHGTSPIEGIGTMVAAKKKVDGATYFQYAAYDHRGTVYRLVDENDNIIETREYNAWGMPLQRQLSAVGGRFGWQSNWIELRDSAGELILSPFRLYSAENGLFLQRDMFGFVDGLNLYRAFANSPLSFGDSLGGKLDSFIKFLGKWKGKNFGKPGVARDALNEFSQDLRERLNPWDEGHKRRADDFCKWLLDPFSKESAAARELLGMLYGKDAELFQDFWMNSGRNAERF